MFIVVSSKQFNLTWRAYVLSVILPHRWTYSFCVQAYLTKRYRRIQKGSE